MPQVNPVQSSGGGVKRAGTGTDCTQANITGDGNKSTPVPTTGVIGIGGVGIDGSECPGVVGSSTSSDGVSGNSTSGTGVSGTSQSSWGVYGQTDSGAAAVCGVGVSYAIGVFGSSPGSHGVLGKQGTASGIQPPYDDYTKKTASCGVWGDSYGGCGVFGSSAAFDGVHGQCSGNHAGVSGTNYSGKGYAIWAQVNDGGIAGHFDGPVECTRHIHCGDPNNPPPSPAIGSLYVDNDVVLLNADCAEDFGVVSAQEVDPGTVMVIDEKGLLKRAERAYDKRVAGVISGAGACRPAIVLNRRRAQMKRVPLALVGTVYCKVDSQYGPIEVGDLLTTSATPGHAMKAGDPLNAFGTVIGKALGPLKSGKGLIPILIALQ
jgi:hypothetical protein